MIPRPGWPPVREVAVYIRFPEGISVLFPALSDAQSLTLLLAPTKAVLQRVGDDCAATVVTDGGMDNKAEVPDEPRGRYGPWFRVAAHGGNRGYGAALRSGFEAATKEYVFCTNGDGRDDPAEIATLLRAVTPETGLVDGDKIVRSSPRNIDGNFRLIRRTILDPTPPRSTGGAIGIVLVRQVELGGSEAIELPSRFFRVRTFVSTCTQLCSFFGRLVLAAAFSKNSAARPGSIIGPDTRLDPNAVNFGTGTANAYGAP
jgi:hypothetical protein